MTLKDMKKRFKMQLKMWMHDLAEKCTKMKLSQKSIGIIIRTMHMTAPPNFALYVLFGSYLLSTATMIFLFGVLVMFYTFDSCFLSVLEQKLCNDDFVIIDPALELCDLQINTANRYYISNVIGITYMISMCLIYYIRFYL